MRISIPIMGMATNGGIRNLLMLADLAIEAGHEVTFYCPRGTITHNFFAANKKIRIEEIGPAIDYKPLAWVLIGLLFPFINRGDLIVVGHFFPYFPSLFARRKKRVVYLVQGLEYRCYRGIIRRIAKFVTRLAFRSRHLYAANRLLYDELLQLGSPKGYISMGIDDVFLDTPARTRAAEDKPFDIIYFLRRSGYKRLDRFKRILPALQEKGYRILCVGQEAPVIEEFERFDVTITRPAHDAELIQCIDSARILVYTSDYEGFALPPLECMARGVPAVLYDCGGPSNYARHNHNAIVLENNDSAPLVENIERLLNDRALYKKLAENARQTAEGMLLKPELERFLEQITSDMDTATEPGRVA